MKKFKKRDEVAITDLLVHSIQYLDVAAEIAERNQYPEMMLKVYKQSLKASDRLISIILHLEEDEEYVGEPGSEKGNFGFVIDEPEESESICELEESPE